MKSLVTVKKTLLVFSLLTSQALVGTAIKQIPKSPSDITEQYYKTNSTVLVPALSLQRTIKRVQKLTDKDSLAITANLEELTKTVQIGAYYLNLFAHSTEQQITELAQKINASEVPSIIKYLYSQSCTIRANKTGFTEGIIVIKSGNKYYTGLKTFLESYCTRVKKGDVTQKSSNIPLILPAKTSGAFRLMCVTITETNQEKMAPFLDRFKDFHITISDESIHIKPERHPKVGIINRIIVKAGATANAGPAYNKTSDIPSILIDTFVRTFPNAKVKHHTIGCMYNWILTELKTAQDEKKLDILKCKSVFEKIATINGLSHLSDRIGSEIILDEEELLESYFSEKNSAAQNKNWKDACGIYLAFKAIRDNIRTYITSSQITENSIRVDIDNFYALITDKAIESVDNKEIQKYFKNTALTLKYLATIKEEILPNTPIITLKERLTAAVFEQDYQAGLKLELIAEKLLGEQYEEKLAKTDTIIAEDLTTFWKKHQDIFSKKFPLELTKNTNLGKLKVNQNDLFEAYKDIYSKTTQPFNKLVQTAQDLAIFKQSQKLLDSYAQHLVGTTLTATQEKNEWGKNSFHKNLESFYKELKTVIKNIVQTVEDAGFYCAAGEQGKKIISETCCEQLKFEKIKKEPKSIDLFKKSTHVFASIGQLKETTVNILKQQKTLDEISNKQGL